MQQREFGRTGRAVSEVGLGCWQMGGDWGAMDEETALTTLQAAADSGVTFLDTADVYGLGRSESLIGTFLQQNDTRLFVATKLGRFPGSGFPDAYTEASLRACTEASLQRLGVESLDLTQLHCVPTGVLRRGDVFEWLRTLQQDGLIQHFGVSVETVEEGLLCLEQDGVVSLQVIFNLFRQKPMETLFARARERGVAVIVRLPLASGLLTGKYTKDTQFAPEDHRTYNRDGEAFNVGETFAGLPFAVGVERADGLKPLVPQGMTLTQMAMRWILDFPAVSTIIPGAKNPEQARANAAISDLPPLSSELHARLRDYYDTAVAAYIRGPY